MRRLIFLYLVILFLLSSYVGWQVFVLRSPFSSLLLSSLSLFIVLGGTLGFSKLRWYEPVCAMSIMFFMLVVGCFYLAVTGFSHAEHLLHPFYESPELSALAILFTSLWVLCFYFGYWWGRKEPENVPSGESFYLRAWVMPSSLLYTFAGICFFIGTANVLYNIWLFNPNDPVSYFLQFGVARHRIQVNQGIFSTFGYHFLLVGLILTRLTFSIWTQKRIIFMALVTALVLLVFLTRGQIFFTFSVAIFLLVLEYFLSNNREIFLKRMILLSPILVVITISAYLMRLVSVELFLAERAGVDINIAEAFVAKVLTIGENVLGKGNVPNLPAMMVYQDHYGSVSHFLYGKSLFSWLGAFIPGFSGTYIGYEISDLWYPNNVGGIPPGIVYETYANFGFLGALAFSIMFGAFSAFMFNYLSNARSLIFCVVYSALFVRFWFILPKVEMAVLSNAIWLFLPTVAILYFIRGVELMNALRRR